MEESEAITYTHMRELETICRAPYDLLEIEKMEKKILSAGERLKVNVLRLALAINFEESISKYPLGKKIVFTTQDITTRIRRTSQQYMLVRSLILEETKRAYIVKYKNDVKAFMDAICRSVIGIGVRQDFETRCNYTADQILAISLDLLERMPESLNLLEGPSLRLITTIKFGKIINNYLKLDEEDKINAISN